MAFEDLYQEIILDHSRHPRNAASLDHIPEENVHENPSCGDSLKLELILGEDKSVERIRFDGRGCAISMASASIMTEQLKGKSLEEAKAKIAEFLQVMRGEAPADCLDDRDELVCLKGVIQFPLRVKCATLAWHALEENLNISVPSPRT